MKYKGIILVIASPKPYYNNCKIIMEKFMNSHPNFKTFFIYGKANKEKNIPSKNDLFFNCPESLRPGILMKSILAFQHILKNYDFDYVIRTNISTFWNLNQLDKLLNKLPNKNCVAGQIQKKKFVTGTGIILSKNLVRYICNNKHKIRINRCDDVELSQFFSRHLGLPFILDKRCERFKEKFPINKKIVPKNFTNYRLKTKKNRYLDALKMFKLYKMFYKK